MVETKTKKEEYKEYEEYVPQEIWVDHDMKKCEPTRKGARHATYNPEYELYVIDH